MNSSWRSASAAELQANGSLLVEDGNHGEYRPRPHEFVEDGVAFIRAADLDDGRILFVSASRINDIALNRIRKGVGQPGDILLSHKGTVGKVAMAPLDAEPFVCSPQTTFWRVLDKEVFDRQFLFAYLRSPSFRAQLSSRKGETDMADYVSLTSQRGLRVPVPPVRVQQAIGQILGTLDDKIELNRQMNQTLEQIAATLFKSWFGVFDPVRAKAEDRQPEGMDAGTAALFPDRLVESEIGEIPEGWQVVPVGDVITAVGGSTPPTGQSEFWEGSIPFATPKDLSKLDAPVLLTTERHITDAGLARISSGLIPRHSLLMSSRAPIGYLAINEVPVSVNQGMIVMICDKDVSPWFMLGWARTNMEEIVGRANGTTFLEISKRNFRPIPAVMPSREVRMAYDNVVEPLLARLTSNLKQNQTLASLRDTLLPRLLSGELRVPTDVLNDEDTLMQSTQEEVIVQSRF